MRGPGPASVWVRYHTSREVLPGASSTVNCLLGLKLHLRRQTTLRPPQPAAQSLQYPRIRCNKAVVRVKTHPASAAPAFPRAFRGTPVLRGAAADFQGGKKGFCDAVAPRLCARHFPRLCRAFRTGQVSPRPGQLLAARRAWALVTPQLVRLRTTAAASRLAICYSHLHPKSAS